MWRARRNCQIAPGLACDAHATRLRVAPILLLAQAVSPPSTANTWPVM
jgi:hypothetical protein